MTTSQSLFLLVVAYIPVIWYFNNMKIASVGPKKNYFDFVHSPCILNYSSIHYRIHRDKVS
jgi:hypothetical protein